ncbi:PIN domain-containing protein [Candidatus Woesearchaeota archaeon]|nr:PIN domain-containing protein [Candidatus Woesearchaeota archaeon]
MNQKQEMVTSSFVLDSNILISALIRNGTTREIILRSNFNFYVPYIIVEEVCKYKQLIIQKGKFSELDFELLFSLLLEHMVIVPSMEFIYCLNEAEQIMQHVDIDDSLYLALALAKEIPLWSNDAHFKVQNKVRIYTTKDMIRLCCFRE